MRSKWTKIAVITITAALAVLILILSREWISKKVFMREGQRLAARFNPEQQKIYNEELDYTLGKFWSCYKKGLVSRNDLTDVKDRMKRLSKREEIKNKDIIIFIGYVSRIYTDAMHEYHDRTLTK